MRLFDLRGRVAIVTGGNGGIGLGMARALAEAGAAVVIAARDTQKAEAALKDLAGGASAHMSVTTDVTSETACAALVSATLERFKRVDILVNNAGINIRKRPEDLAAQEWAKVVDVNLTSAFLCAKAVHSPMRAAGGGKIINVGSMLSIFGVSYGVAYGASKGGIVQMTKSLAVAWAADGIQVNAVLPGWIDTELTRKARVEVEGLHDRVMARTPAARWGEAEDLAGIAVFLAGHASDFVTGVAIPVDGGYSIQG